MMGGNSNEHEKTANKLARVSTMLLERNSKGIHGKNNSYNNRLTSQFIEKRGPLNKISLEFVDRD